MNSEDAVDPAAGVWSAIADGEDAAIGSISCLEDDASHEGTQHHSGGSCENRSGGMTGEDSGAERTAGTPLCPRI